MKVRRQNSDTTGQADNFVHLHVHSEYSPLDGMNKVEDLPHHVKSLGMTAIAITDHGTLGGCYRFFKECNDNTIKPIIGIEAYYTLGNRSIRALDEYDQKYYHLILLAQNNAGLKNLFKVSSLAHKEGFYYAPRIDDELLATYSEGIIATSSCLGSSSSQMLLRGERQKAESLIKHHAEIFRDRFFLELQLHGGDEQGLVNDALLELHKNSGLPLIITGDCHYMKEDEKELHEQLLCIQTRSTMSNPKRLKFETTHVAPHDYMWTKAQDQEIPYDGIINTKYIADSIDSDSYFSDRMNRYPQYKCPDGLASWQYLDQLCFQKIKEKFSGAVPCDYLKRLRHELRVIKRLGFSDYILIVWDFMQGAKQLGIATGAGRGSAAGSLVAYLLDITKVDPIKYSLLFERFLNEGRAATPLIFDAEFDPGGSNSHPMQEYSIIEAYRLGLI